MDFRSRFVLTKGNWGFSWNFSHYRPTCPQLISYLRAIKPRKMLMEPTRAFDARCCESYFGPHCPKIVTMTVKITRWNRWGTWPVSRSIIRWAVRKLDSIKRPLKLAFFHPKLLASGVESAILAVCCLQVFAAKRSRVSPIFAKFTIP